MAQYRFGNNPQTTLSGGVTAGATSITVASGSTFPATGRFPIIVDSEIMHVTGVTGTVWTVERGAEGTAAAAHNNNAAVTGVVTEASFLSAHWYDVRSYGAVGDGVTDDTTAIQAAITDAFNAPGGVVVFPAGNYKVTSTLATPYNTAGAVKLLGFGRPRNLTGGNSGEPVADQGVTITYTGTTGDIFLASVATGNTRQYITIEGIYFQGNKASGTSGHGLHFLANSMTVSILPTLRDVTVNGCKQHGIWYDGNVFESQMYNVRSSQNGLSGLAGSANSGALPGETRLYGCSFLLNEDNGIQWSGGGGLSFFGLTCTYNSNQGLEASGCNITGSDLTLEYNGDVATGSQATFTGAAVRLTGVGMTVHNGGTGKGLEFINANWNMLIGYFPNSSVAGVGYQDIVFDNTSSRCTVMGYNSDDFVDRVDWGTGGGHRASRGNDHMTFQTHAQATHTISSTGGLTFDARKYDSFLVSANAAGINITINNPTMFTDYHYGQRVTVQILNNTAGAITTSWQSAWALAGAWTDPAAGKTRTIQFEWDDNRNKFYEISRSAADIS